MQRYMTMIANATVPKMPNMFSLISSNNQLKVETKQQEGMMEKIRTPYTLIWYRGKASTCNAGEEVQSLGREDLLEEEMATHSGIPAWEIPWTEKPGGLQSMGLQKSRT